MPRRIALHSTIIAILCIIAAPFLGPFTALALGCFASVASTWWIIHTDPISRQFRHLSQESRNAIGVLQRQHYANRCMVCADYHMRVIMREDRGELPDHYCEDEQTFV